MNKQKLLMSKFFLLLLSFTILPQFVNANDTDLNILSEAAVLIDSQSGEILYEKNATKKMYPASITKIVTAIVAIETLDDLSEIATVSENATLVEGTRVYLVEGEQMSIYQLLQGMMVNSGNDAAIVIAEHIDGSVEKFADRMNDFAREKIGVSEKTNFTNPHGLFEENHTVTALDMAKISAYAMKNEVFRELAATETVEWYGEEWETVLVNHHPLIRSYDHIIGIKNGYVSRSGYTLTTASKIGNNEFISVTLNSPSKYVAMEDTEILHEFAHENFETKIVTFTDEPLLTHFIYPDEIIVTTPIGEKINKSISENGLVTITGENGRIIETFQLQKREVLNLPFFMTDPPKKTQSSENKVKALFDWFVVTGFYIVALNFEN